MNIKFLVIIAILVADITTLRDLARQPNKPRTQKQKDLKAKSNHYKQEYERLKGQVKSTTEQDDSSKYNKALKELAAFQKEYLEFLKETRNLLQQIDDQSNGKTDITKEQEKNSLNEIQSIRKQVDNLQKEVDQDEKQLKQAKQNAEKQKRIEKKVAQVQNSESLSLAKMTDAQKTTKIISSCIKAAANATPPEFCWKNADFGHIPTACPAGFQRTIGCHQKCPAGYYFSITVCSQYCPKGYEDFGLYCHRWWPLHSRGKHTFFPEILTNFDSRVPCPEGMYKFGCMCYRDCSKVGMVNCGIGACSRDTASCVQNVVNMVISTIEGVIEAVGLVVSLGSSSGMSSGFSVLSDAAKNIGKATLKGMMKGVKQWFKNITKKQLVKIMVEAVKEKIKHQIVDAALNATIKLVCTNVAEQFKANIEKKQSDFDFKALDITGISHAVQSCKGHDGIECARSIVEIVELIDPTGLTTIAAAYMHGTCKGV